MPGYLPSNIYENCIYGTQKNHIVKVTSFAPSSQDTNNIIMSKNAGKIRNAASMNKFEVCLQVLEID